MSWRTYADMQSKTMQIAAIPAQPSLLVVFATMRPAFARWFAAISCWLCLAQAFLHASGQTASVNAVQATAGDMGWWLRTDSAEIRGGLNVPRIVRRGSTTTTETEDVSTLKTSDGAVYRVSAEGRVERYEKTVEAPAPVDSNGGDEGVFGFIATFCSIFGSRSAAFGQQLASDLADVSPAQWMACGRAALNLFAQIFGLIVIMRVICHWIDVSYSKEALVRLALLFVAAGELVSRVVPGGS